MHLKGLSVKFLSIRDVLAISVFTSALLLFTQFAQAQEIQAWGDNRYSQRSVPASVTGSIAISGGLGHSAALKYDGTVSVWGLLVSNTVVTDVKAISAGGLHMLALKTDGTVVAWGTNTDGRTSVPAGLTDVKAVQAGFSHSLALKADGTVVAWGSNGFGQCSVPSGLNNVVAIASGAVYSLALKADGTVVSWGSIGSPPTGLTGVIAISAGSAHSLALKSDGTVVAWGDNGNNQCNIPAGLANVIAIAAGEDHSVALRADGTVVAWGSNAFGQVSVPSGLTGVVEIAAGQYHTMVRKSTGTRLNVWGSNLSTLGSPSFDVSGIKAVSAGRTAGLALHSDGTVTAWGTGAIVTAFPSGLAGVKAIAAGIDHGIALKADGTLVSWGSNSFGERDVPPGLTGIKAIVAGAYHNVALTADGTVVRWGNSAANTGFPSGLSTVVDIASGSVHNIALRANGTVVAWGNNSAGQSTVPSGLSNVIDIAGGNQHSLAAKADGKVIGWGTDTDGQHSFPASLASVKSVAAGQTHSIVLKSDGSLETTGLNGVSASTIPLGLNAVISIDSRLNNNVAIVIDQPPVISGITSSVTYTENATAQRLQNTLTITDNGHTSLSGATISIANNFLSGDILEVTVPGGLTQSYDETSGVLTITGTASVASFQSMFRSLTYHSTSESPALHAARTVSITATDGSLTSSPALFTVTINAVNDAPSFTKGDDVAINEDAGSQTVLWATNISAGPEDEGSQTLSFTVSNDNNDLFSAQPAIDATGQLTFVPAADRNGSALVTIILNDDGGTANEGVDQSGIQTFTITVYAVNDPPAFTKGVDVVVYEDAGTQTLNNWAIDISSGPLNEHTQTVNFILSNDNNDLFSIQPSLDNAGNLTFTTAPDAYGTASVTVTLEDNGGIANGGIDTYSETFTITTMDVNDPPSFTSGPDITVLEDAMEFTQVWATDLSAGEDEDSQRLDFNVTVSNPSLFITQPTINSSGTLSFKVAPNISGSSTVDVVLSDNGGTSHGGIDKTQSILFTIDVVPVNDAPGIDLPEDITVQLTSGVFTTSLTGIHASEEDQLISIEASSSDPAIVTINDIQYTPGNSVAALMLSPSTHSGTATISVTVKDNGGVENGGDDETTVIFAIIVEQTIHEVFVPNLFSPDGNGTNDVFRIRTHAQDIVEIGFRVYNSNGQEVFNTTDLTTAFETGWDGRYQGKEQPSGMYTWTLTGKHRDGRELTSQRNKYGQVMLVR